MFRSWLAASVAVAALTLSFQVQALETDELEATVTPAAEAAAVPAVIPAAPAAPVSAAFEGPVSYYGNEFAGRKTSNGERFDPSLLTMAHRSLPFGTLVRITNLFNNKSVVVRVNDRGPFIGGRIGDVSAAAANLLDMLRAGVVRARLEVLNATGLQALK